MYCSFNSQKEIHLDSIIYIIKHLTQEIISPPFLNKLQMPCYQGSNAYAERLHHREASSKLRSTLGKSSFRLAYLGGVVHDTEQPKCSREKKNAFMHYQKSTVYSWPIGHLFKPITNIQYIWKPTTSHLCINAN